MLLKVQIGDSQTTTQGTVNQCSALDQSKKAHFYRQNFAEVDTKDTFRLLNSLMCTDKPKSLLAGLKCDDQLALVIPRLKKEGLQ